MGNHGKSTHMVALFWSRATMRWLVILHEYIVQDFLHPHSHWIRRSYGRETCAAEKLASEAQRKGISALMSSIALWELCRQALSEYYG